MIKVKLDLQKLTGTRIFDAKDGTKNIAIPLDANNIYLGEKGVYLNIDVNERKEEDKYGNTHSVKLDLGKDRRDEKQYVGEGKEMIFNNSKPTQQQARPAQQAATQDGDDSDIPF